MSRKAGYNSGSRTIDIWSDRTLVYIILGVFISNLVCPSDVEILKSDVFGLSGKD